LPALWQVDPPIQDRPECLDPSERVALLHRSWHRTWNSQGGTRVTVHEQPWGETREWYTPPGLFERLRLGDFQIGFDLDPASPMSGPVPWIPAIRFYSPRDNGLMQPWKGRVWLNPPYGPPGVAFVHRMVEHGNGMLLVPARTETRWFQHAAHAADVVCFLRDRLHFVRPDGTSGRASFASALMGFGYQCGMSLASSDLGWTVVQAKDIHAEAVA
jgi:hypothetical protein